MYFGFPCSYDLLKQRSCTMPIFESLTCKSQNLGHHTVANVLSGHPVLQGPCHSEQPDPGEDMKHNFQRNKLRAIEATKL